MNITGTAHMNAPLDVAWAAFHDPGVLSRTIPGVKRLTETGPDAYALSVLAGVASIKGVYEGDVSLSQQREHESFVLTANGSGGPGTIGATVTVRLVKADDGGTDIAYDADAVVGGAIGGVGQRMLGGVARRLATQFFAAIDADIARGGATGPEAGQQRSLAQATGEASASAAPSTGGDSAPAFSATTAAPAPGTASPEPSARSWGPAAAAPGSSGPSAQGVPAWAVLAGVGVGAFWTLAGVVVGYRMGRRSDR